MTQYTNNYATRDVCYDSSLFTPAFDWGAIEQEARRCRKRMRKTATATAAIDSEFKQLASQWKRETAIFSSLSRIVMHPAYQRIMAMGPAVIPLILRDLAQREEHWFWALHNLVEQGQDPAEGLTTIPEATSAWLRWGRDRKLL